MDQDSITKVGIGIVLGVFAARVYDLLTRKEVPAVQVLPVPFVPKSDGPKLEGPKRDMPPADKLPVLLTSNPIPVATGRRYRTIMTVGFPFSLAANEAAVKREAEDLGFSGVQVSRVRPSDFPGTGRGDYYVDARWGSAPTSIARPNIPGLSLVEAWEG